MELAGAGRLTAGLAGFLSCKFLISLQTATKDPAFSFSRDTPTHPALTLRLLEPDCFPGLPASKA